jgi:hypothetical protein
MKKLNVKVCLMAAAVMIASSCNKVSDDSVNRMKLQEMRIAVQK